MVHEQRLAVLQGILQDDHPLSVLCKDEFSLVFKKLDDELKKHIDRDCIAFEVLPVPSFRVQTPLPGYASAKFPEPRGINVNMMPIMHPWHRPGTIPDYLKGYMDLIMACPVTQRHRVMYLTVQEGWVDAGQTQRRPGLHIEQSLANRGRAFRPGEEGHETIAWGGGFSRDRNLFLGGIYMASNVADSCRVWPVLIRDPGLVVDKHGGIEHMRHLLGGGHALAANELVWMTDHTPHESLPAKQRCYRQFFRLVVGGIGVWYSKHNTPNPRGVEPSCPVSDEDKFAATEHVIDAADVRMC
jgi:hypothetical protein